MIPNLFSKAGIPDEIPAGMQTAIKKFRRLKNKEECLRCAYDILAKKYRGKRWNTYTRFFKLFDTNLERIWNRGGFLHCTTLNYLLRILLVKSGFFKDEDLKLRWSMVWYISLHQYLKVRINPKRVINVDLWGKSYGIKFGDYSHGFH